MPKVSVEPIVKLPFYARASLIVVGLFVFLSMLVLAKSIIIPLIFATMIAILLSTVVDFLVQRKVDRVLAITITIVVALMIGVLIGLWLSSKANVLIDALPVLEEKFDVLQEKFVAWGSENLGVNSRKANSWLNKARTDLTGLSGEKIGNALAAIISLLVVLLLVPVYIFLLLFYQPLIIDFIHRACGKGNEGEVSVVLGQTRTILKGYFAGLLIELVIVATMSAIGLLLLGIQFAILIAIAGAVLNMIPYLGGAITLGMSVLVALLTKEDTNYVFYVAILFFAIQVIDNNFLMPKIVGSKVKINALVAIVAVISGGALWGIPGMFLAIPLTAIVKVIFDSIEPLKPWGFLLGDTMPPMVRLKFRGRRKAA